MKYIETLNSEMREYFKILSPDFPEFLEEYIATPAMQRIDKISQSIGWDYSTYRRIKYFSSKLCHSVGVALVVWHFTHDKVQTLAGLFHDIASPVFLHAIDFLNGDNERQESTEDKTYEMIKNSKEIMEFLARDGISIDEVYDYHIYPVADNDTPRLSADRLEYTFSCALTQQIYDEKKDEYFYALDFDDIAKFYGDMTLSKNEDGVTEIAFAHAEVAEEYILKISKLWPTWCNENNRVFMQFLADIVGSTICARELSVNDLYTLPEREVIDKILNSKIEEIATAMKNFMNGKVITISDEQMAGKYCVKVKGKKRYIVPLVEQDDGTAVRITTLSEAAKNIILEFETAKFDKYGCLDFDFSPIKK